MVHCRPEFGQRSIGRWTAVILAAASAVLAPSLISSFAYGHPAPPSSPAAGWTEGSDHASPEPSSERSEAPAPSASAPAGGSSPPATAPAPPLTPDTSPSATPGAQPSPSRRAAPAPRSRPRPVVKPVEKPAAPAPVELKAPMVVPDAEFVRDGAPPNRVPEAGSQPRMGPDAAAVGAAEGAKPNVENSAGWDFLSDPEVGVRIFFAGFTALLFSIGGLVTVAIRRRQW